MPKFTFDEAGAAWKSMSGKKWMRPIPQNMIGSIVRLFHDREDGTTEYHDYDLDGRVVVGDGPSDKHLDNIIGGWTTPFARIKPTDAVEEADVEKVEEIPAFLKRELEVAENLDNRLAIAQAAEKDRLSVMTQQEMEVAATLQKKVDSHGHGKWPLPPPNPIFYDDAATTSRSGEGELRQTLPGTGDLVGRDQLYSHARYNELVENTFTELRNLGELKGGEYAGDLDRLANFRRNGLDLGVPMELVWRIYAAKHWDAIGQYVRDSITGKERVRLESIEGRIDDLIVYLLLFKAMVDERGMK